MIPELIKFECLKCGACCKDLLEEKSGKLGLFLLPSETSLFPKEMVFPSLGFDKHLGNTNTPDIIAAYQFSGIDCPHYKNDIGCQIYSIRPIICKAFPLTLGPIKRKYIIKLLPSDKCTFLKPYQTRYIEREVGFLFDGINEQAEEDLKAYFIDLVKTYSYMRLFDLGTFKWCEQMSLWYG